MIVIYSYTHLLLYIGYFDMADSFKKIIILPPTLQHHTTHTANTLYVHLYHPMTPPGLTAPITPPILPI
jgi:hypothetical protein